MLIRTLAILLFFQFHIVFGQEQKARQVVQQLCSEAFLGRGYIDSGVNKAAEYLVREFEQVGLSPFFDDTSFLQSYYFDVNTFPANMRVQIGSEILDAGIDYLVDERSGSYNGRLNLTEITADILTNEAQFKEIIRGVQDGEKNGFLFDITEFDAQDQAFLKQQFAALATIGTMVFLTEEKFTWSVAQEQLKYPILYLQKEKYRKEAFTINIDAVLVRNYPNKNIAGYLPADHPKAKTLVFTAHYDHLGAMGTQPELTYFPGGNDNASGTAMLLSLAEHFKDQPRKYNLLFIAFSGEEIGLLGSKHFVESSVFDLKKIKFLVNLDIMGSGEEGITVVNGTIHKKQFKTLQKINHKQHYLAKINARGEAANSDHHYFHQAGVPAIFIYTMGPNKNYHDVYDTYDALSFAAYKNILNLLVDFIGKI